MKFLLTPASISNDSVQHALVDLLGKPITVTSVLCIPTAIYPFPDGAGHTWGFISGRNLFCPMCDLDWHCLGVLDCVRLHASPPPYAL